MTHSHLLVAAGALCDSNGLWLMHQRPPGKSHAGLWEFPGGKVESTEIPTEALVRELHEELGIRVSVSDCMPRLFAEQRDVSGQPAIVILLYTIAIWEGKPAALEGGEVDWFTPQQIQDLEKPPLDVSLVAQMFCE